MSEPKADLPLLSLKTALGPPVHLDYRALDLAEAHCRLGEHVRAQVHHILREKIQASAPEALAEQVRLARYCQAAIGRKLANSSEEILRSALEEYVTCLAAWERGAELAAFGADRLRGTLVDGQPVSGANLAYMLQDDETGCQTGLWRAADGSVFLWHTEEDRLPLGERFDRLRYVHFTVAGPGSPAQLASFIYPDLLPGPAFGWRSDNYVQAVDTLNLKPKAPGSGILANIATWVTLRLGSTCDLDDTLRYLGPFADGYALNVAQAQGGGVLARNVEFAGADMHSRSLGRAPGSFLFQVNKFSDSSTPIARTYEAAATEKCQRLEERVARAKGWLQTMPVQPDAREHLFRLMCSQAGGDYAYANGDVKAYLIAQSTVRQLQVSIGTGPALAGDEPETYCGGLAPV